MENMISYGDFTIVNLRSVRFISKEEEDSSYKEAYIISFNVNDNLKDDIIWSFEDEDERNDVFESIKKKCSIDLSKED